MEREKEGQRVNSRNSKRESKLEKNLKDKWEFAKWIKRTFNSQGRDNTYCSLWGHNIGHQGEGQLGD